MSCPNQFKLTPLIVSHINSFLEAYHNELQNIRANKSTTTTSSSSSNSFSSFFDSAHLADPTTANALNTSTVVILRKKKSSSLKNSPFDGVRLSNYRLQTRDVQCEVFDWVSHFLWLKNCPLELANLISSYVAHRMSEETARKFEEYSPKSELMPTLASPEVIPGLDLPSMPSPSESSAGSLPSALCSMDVARQSRDVMDNYIEELATEPEQTVHLVEDYVSGASNGTCTPTGPKGFTSSVFAIKNGRKTMEDRHIMIHDLNKTLNLKTDKQYSYYAIFDGHAGVDAASYSTAHLHCNLVATEAFSQNRIEDAFREAFELTDSNYIKRCREEGIDQLKPSGTTALCALVEDNKTVYMAWVGDSQAVLVRNGCIEEIMLPHKPDLDSERIRIQELGGLVVFVDTWRVNGILSVTRAIGDPDHKPFVIAEPSISKFEIDPSLDFLVLGCDGLFDQLTGQDIASHVFEFLCKNENRDPQEVIYDVSAYLSQMAIREGSSDNITSIVLFFKPFEQLVATGLPSNSEDEMTAESRQELESVLSTTLPTTNGGHFPYTDFSELPIGANFNLHAMPEVSTSTDKSVPFETNDVEVDTLTATQTNLIEEKLATGLTELAATDLPTEWSYHELPAAVDTPVFLPQPELLAMEPNDQLNQSPTFQSQSNVFAANTEPQPVHHFQTNSAFNPFAMEEAYQPVAAVSVTDEPIDQLVDYSALDGNLLIEEQVSKQDITESSNEHQPIMVSFDNFSQSDVDKSSLDLANQNLTSALLTTSEKSESIVSESSATAETVEKSQEILEPADESVPDIVQHASDSGFCYTNSISEFSTSFPSESKIEDNFCSTPVHNEPYEEPSVPEPRAESSVVDYPSLLQSTPTESQPLLDDVPNVIIAENVIENYVDQTCNNWETSLQNNSLLIENSTPANESVIPKDIDPQIQPEPTTEPEIENEKINSEPIIEHVDTLLEESHFEQQPSNIISETVFANTDLTSEQTSPLINVNPFAISAESTVETNDLIPLENSQTTVSIQEEVCLLNSASELNLSPVDMMDQLVKLDEAVTESQINSSEQTELALTITSEDILIPTEVPSLEATDKEVVAQESVVAPHIELEEPCFESTKPIEPIETNQIGVHEQSLTESVVPTIENLIPVEATVKVANEPKAEQKDNKALTKPKVVSAVGTKKPLASTLASKTKPAAAASKLTSTLPKPSLSKLAITKTASKPTTSTATRAVPTKVDNKTTTTKSPSSTIPKPATSTLKARTSLAPKANGTTASRVASTQKAVTTTATTRTAVRPTSSTTAAPRMTNTVKSTIPKASAPTRPLTSHATTSQLKPTDSKPSTLRKSLPLSSVSARPLQSTLTRPNPAKSSPLSAAPPTTRTARAAVSSSALSKVAPIRPTTAAKPLAKTTPSVAAKSAAATKPVNGTSAATSGIKAVKKPIASPKVAESNVAHSSTQQNGSMKPIFSAKRPIGVENSLKQELEDAVMNGLNGSNTDEIVNGVNGHNGQ